MSSDCEQINNYRIFLEALTSISEGPRNDLLRQNVDNYKVNSSELKGEILSSIVNHLETNNCPAKLLVPIALNTLDEVVKECKKSVCSFDYSEPAQPSDDNQKFYDLAKLNKFTISSLRISAARFLDNAEMNKILTNAAATDTIDDNSDLGNHNATLIGLPSTAIHVVGSIRNKRRKMEDRYICLDRFHELYKIKHNRPCSFYGVFDGHRGSLAAAYAASQIPKLIADSLNRQTIGIQALKSAILQTDQDFSNKQLPNGTTAICALYCPSESYLYVGWVGDSKAMLAKKSNLIQLVTRPHKPSSKEEEIRIRNSGGSLILTRGEWRVNGIYNVSRAIGDNETSQLISDPDGVCVQLDGKEDFLIMATDGLWDHASEEEIGATVYQALRNDYESFEQIPRLLIDLAKKGNSTDNITVAIVFFKHPSQIAKNEISAPLIMESAFKTTEMDDFIEERQRELYHHGLNSMNKFGDDDLDQLDLSWNNKSGKAAESTTSTTTMKTDEPTLINDGESNLEFSNLKQQLTSDDDNNFNHLQQTTENHANDYQMIDMIDNDGLDLINVETMAPNNFQNDFHHNHQAHFDHQQNEQNELDNCRQKQQMQNQIFGITTGTNADNDFGPETCVDVTDDVVMMTENSADTNLLEQSTLSHSKDTLASSTDNCNPFDNRNILVAELDANKATPLLSPEVEDLPLSEAASGGDGDEELVNNRKQHGNGVKEEDVDHVLVSDRGQMPIGCCNEEEDKKLDEPSFSFQQNYFMQANGHLSPEIQPEIAHTSEIAKSLEKMDDDIQERDDDMIGECGDYEEEEDGGKSTAELSISDNENDRDNVENEMNIEKLSTNVEFEVSRSEKLVTDDFATQSPLDDHANLLEEIKPDQEQRIDTVLIENVKESSADSEFIEQQQNDDNMARYNQNGDIMQMTNELADNVNDFLSEPKSPEAHTFEKELFCGTATMKECHKFKEDLEAVNEQIRSMRNSVGGVSGALNYESSELDIDDIGDVRLKEEEEILEKHHTEELHATAMSPERVESPEQDEQNENSFIRLSEQESAKVFGETATASDDELHETECKSEQKQEFFEEIYEKHSVTVTDLKTGSEFESQFLHSEHDSEAVAEPSEEDQVSQDVEKVEEFKNILETMNEIKSVEETENEIENQHLEKDENAFVTQSRQVEQEIFENNYEQQTINESFAFEHESSDQECGNESTLPAETTENVNQREQNETELFGEKHVDVDEASEDFKIKTNFNENFLSSPVEEEVVSTDDRNRQQQLEYQRSTIPDFVSNEATVVSVSPQSEEEEWKYVKEVQSSEKQQQGLVEHQKHQAISEGEEDEDDDDDEEVAEEEKVTKIDNKLSAAAVNAATGVTEQQNTGADDIIDQIQISSRIAVEKIDNSVSSNLILHNEQHNIFKDYEDPLVAAADAAAAAAAAEADMNSKLNPEAKEFVPSSSYSPTSPISIGQQQQQQKPQSESQPQSSPDDLNRSFVYESQHNKQQQQPQSPPPHLSNGTPNVPIRQHRLLDDVVAQSPHKGRESNMENIMIPSVNEFADDIAKRPHSDDDLLNTSVDLELAAADINVIGGGDATGRNALYQEKDIVAAGGGGNGNNQQLQQIPNILDNADMKESIYIEKLTCDEEDLLNTVQPLPIDSESNNSMEMEFNNDNENGGVGVGGDLPNIITAKEELSIEFEEKDMVSPSTDEMNDIVTLVTNAADSGKQDVIQTKMEKRLAELDKEVTERLQQQQQQQQEQQQQQSQPQPINGVEMVAARTTNNVIASGDKMKKSTATAKSIEAAKNAKNLTKTAAAASSATANNAATKTKVPAAAADTKKTTSTSTAKTAAGTMANKRSVVSNTSAAKLGAAGAASTAAAAAQPAPIKKPTSAGASSTSTVNTTATSTRPRTAPTAAPKAGGGGGGGGILEKKATTASMVSNVKSRIDSKAPATMAAKKLQNSAATANKSAAAAGGKNSSVSAKLSATSRVTLSSTSTTSTNRMARAIGGNSATTVATAANGGGPAKAGAATNLHADKPAVSKTSMTSPRATHASALRKTEALKSPNKAAVTASNSRVTTNGQSTKMTVASRTATSTTTSSVTKTTTTARTASSSATSRRVTTGTSGTTSTTTLAAKTANNHNNVGGAGARKSTPIKKPTAGSAHATPIGRKSISGVKPANGTATATSPAAAAAVAAANSKISNTKTKDASNLSADTGITTTNTIANDDEPKMNGSSSGLVDIATEALEEMAASDVTKQAIQLEIA